MDQKLFLAFQMPLFFDDSYAILKKEQPCKLHKIVLNFLLFSSMQDIIAAEMTEILNFKKFQKNLIMVRIRFGVKLSCLLSCVELCRNIIKF